MTIAEFWNTGKYIDYTGADEADWELLKLDKDMSYTELAQNYPDLLKTLYRHYEEYLGVHLYEVMITETYRKSVLVWSKDPFRAQEYADGLCNCGEIDMERNCFDGRTIKVSAGNAAKFGELPQYYDEDE